MNKTTQIILNVLVGIVSFIVFVVMLFPADAAISHFLVGLENQSKNNTGWRVAVSKIDASIFFDTKFENLRVYHGKDEVFSAPKLSAGFSILPLIFGSVNVRFKALYPKGEIAGQIVLKSESFLDVTFSNLSLDKIPALKKFTGPSALEGKLDGNVYYFWTNDPRNMEAEVNLKIHEVKTQSFGTAALAGLPQAQPGTSSTVPSFVLAEDKNAVQIDAVYKGSQLTLNKLDIPGPDFVMNFSGKAKFDNRNEISRILMDGKFSFDEKIYSQLPALDMIKSFKGADGFYTVAIRGSQKNPKINVGDLDACQWINCQKMFGGQ